MDDKGKLTDIRWYPKLKRSRVEPGLVAIVPGLAASTAIVPEPAPRTVKHLKVYQGGAK